MSGVTAIALTMYPVTNVQRAFAFYRDKLGLRQEGMNHPHGTPYNCLISALRDPDGNTVWLHQKLNQNEPNQTADK